MVLTVIKNKKLGQQIRDYAKQNKKDVEEIARITLFELTNSIAIQSPVNTGRFRSNWFARNTTRSRKTTRATTRDPMKDVSIKIDGAIRKGSTYSFYNNLPYARALEYGLYPKSVKRGSRVRGSKPARYEIRSRYGYSKQAPRGIVRVSIMKIKRDFNKIKKSGKIKTTGSGTRDWS